MAIELKVPSVGESITEVQIGEWLKNEGDSVQMDETIATLDTEKTTVELPAPQSGTLSKIIKNAGDIANVGDVIAMLEASSGAAKSDGAAKSSASNTSPPAEAAANGAPESGEKPSEAASKSDGFVMPSAQRVLSENGASAKNISGSGPGGRITKADAQNATAQKAAPVEPKVETPLAPQHNQVAPAMEELVIAGEDEDVVPMTMLRRKISEHLVSAQQNAALLTTFNEIDMTNVMQIRKDTQEAFQKEHEVKLGFMSFFVKAAVDALKKFPGINAEIRGTNIVYRNHYDIGVAIGGGKGLVVPVLKRAERMSFSEIEIGIGEFAKRAGNNTLKPQELMGGTFTITNGGVYGSLLSTPIVNAPQSGILGMHTIQQRPIALNGQVVIRPMMYVALTYDHRIVDGREAVQFLMRIKECIENPARMLVEA